MRTAIRTAVLTVLIGLLIWHVISWHVGGQQEDMFRSIGANNWDTAKAVLYNLGVVLAFGVLVGLLVEAMTDLLGYEVEQTDHSKDRDIRYG